MKKKKSNINGITLIALIITIIVLLILAGVTIATLTGENGILSKASTAKEKTKQEEGKEAIKLAIAEMTMDLSVKGEKPTIDYIGEHIHEKLDIDKENVTKDGEPTEIVDVIYGDYEYEIDDEFNINVLGSSQGKIIITYTCEETETERIINLTAKTDDEKGIKEIILPNGEVTEFRNHEKEVTIKYEVKFSGKYKFIVKANNGNTKTKTVYIEGLEYFNAIFDENNDFLTPENAYTKSKEELSEEQNEVILEAENRVSNSSLVGTIKNSLDNSWILIGKSNTELMNNYYLYDRYSVNTTTSYVEGTWSAWSDVHTVYGASNAGYYQAYTLNADGTFTVHWPINYFSVKNGTIYYDNAFVSDSQPTKNVGRTITRHLNIDIDYGKVRTSTMTSVPKESYTIKSFEYETISKAGVLPNDGVYSKDKKWYKKKGQAEAYYLYKYNDKEIQTIYDIEKQTINTRKIDLMKNREAVKILVDASNTDYKLSISKDNQNWTEIDNTVLNGETEIKLPEKWNTMYIKINRNNSIINKIAVKY